ncbi:MAG: DUF6624 domain-containing protein [Cyclobacteriaceae bacterium]
MNTRRQLLTLFYAITTFSLSAQDASDIPYDSLRTVLEEVYDQDQGIREELMKYMQQGDSIVPSLIARMNSIDSVNQILVNQIISDYGWLPQSKIGSKAAGAVFLVVQHSDLETMREYLPLLKEAAEAGEAKTTSAALMEDRILMYEGKKQIYGTQASSRQGEGGSNEYFIWPIENPAEENQRRAEAGFDTTVEENAEQLNAVYNPNEELPQ